jgi:hypothetical protein
MAEKPDIANVVVPRDPRVTSSMEEAGARVLREYADIGSNSSRHLAEWVYCAMLDVATSVKPPIPNTARSLIDDRVYPLSTSKVGRR